MKPVLRGGSGWSNLPQTTLPVILGLFWLLFTTSCSFIGLSNPTPATETQTVTPSPGPVTATPAVTIEPTQAPASFIRIWLPSQFDPESGTAAGDILKKHLALFVSENPGVQIEVRVKSEDGPGGLLDSLETANVAAPLALPDLVVLSHPLLEIAAIKGYVKSFGSLEQLLDDAGWYEYAQQLGHLQDSAFGLPFAGEAQLVVFRSSEIELVPKTWDELLDLDEVFGFPAGDPQAMFTLAQYQAAGGSIQDEQGRPTLDEDILADVLTFYQKGQNTGAFPYWLTQLETEAQAWDAWVAGQFPLNVAWSTQLLQQTDLPDIDAGVWPTRTGNPYTPARGWVWALASPNSMRQLWALRLVEYLKDPVFLGQWTEAGGYLPPHRDALAEWSEDSRRQFIGDLAESAQLYPSDNILSVLGPVLRQATLAVLRQQVDPQQAASQAIEQLK